jgi:hypothetical protein
MTKRKSALAAALLLVGLAVLGVVSAQAGAKDPSLGERASLGDAGATGPLVDTDKDGCADLEEIGPEARWGGLRDAGNPWDFFDTNGDQVVDIIDIQRTVYRFGVVKGNFLYHPQYDRSVIGPNNWNLGPGDGAITLVDLMAAFAQYRHECGVAPIIEVPWIVQQATGLKDYEEIGPYLAEILGPINYQLYPLGEAGPKSADGTLQPDLAAAQALVGTTLANGGTIRCVASDGTVLIEMPALAAREEMPPPPTADGDSMPDYLEEEVSADDNPC